MEALIGLGIVIIMWCAFCITMALWRLHEIADNVEEICGQLKKIAEKDDKNGR